MDYIVLNGVKSNTFSGLLISSLPPITKPAMRVSTETIDGVDGDIVTKLGYSAYDKTVTIGLFGGYHIDEIISYFASEGTVIFSNEPDKVYRYQIINQIDFNKLIRFKTADVVFHVQPFKYSAVDGAVSIKTNMISFQDFSWSLNGITLTAIHDLEEIRIEGTATADTDLYMPIDDLFISGTKTLEATSSGDGAGNVKIRLIYEYPSLANTFGQASLSLVDDSTVTQTATLQLIREYNYLWVNVGLGDTVDFTLKLKMLMTENELEVTNAGNTYSKPVITIYGSGLVELYLNSVRVFIVNIGVSGLITLDGEKMNAYINGALANRQVSGNFNNLRLKAGLNVLTWDGSVSKVEVSNYSRWI